MSKSRVADRVFGFIRIPPQLRYALEGARVLARAHGNGPMGAELVASRSGVPAEFLAKILTRLTEMRLLASQKGPGGGYALIREPESISVAEFLRALPGPSHETRQCLIGQHECGADRRCPVHDTAVAAERALTDKFESLTLADLVIS